MTHIICQIVLSIGSINASKQMSHCVGTYSQKVILGKSHILSIKDSAGNALSIAELAVQNQRVSIAQHYGKSNAPPSASAISALTWYCDGINNGSIAVKFNELKTYQENARDKNTLVNALGYDPHNSARLQLAFDLYREAFVRKLQIKTPTEFCEASQLKSRFLDSVLTRHIQPGANDEYYYRVLPVAYNN